MRRQQSIEGEEEGSYLENCGSAKQIHSSFVDRSRFPDVCDTLSSAAVGQRGREARTELLRRHGSEERDEFSTSKIVPSSRREVDARRMNRSGRTIHREASAINLTQVKGSTNELARVFIEFEALSTTSSFGYNEAAIHAMTAFGSFENPSISSGTRTNRTRDRP